MSQEQVVRDLQSAEDMMLQLEKVNASREAAERSRPAFRQALLAFVTGKVRSWHSVSVQRATEFLLMGQEELLKVFQEVVKRNVLVEGGKDAATRLGLAKADWQERSQLLPSFPKMTLAKDIPLVGYNQEIFRLSLCGDGPLAKTMEGMVDYLVNYAEGLISNGLLGFVDYHEGQSASYCYVLRRIKVETEKSKDTETYVKRLPSFDRPNAPQGQRIAYLAYQKRCGSALYWTEKHLHILQKAAQVPFQNYKEAVPIWVDRVKEVIPEWLAPQLQVLKGTIVAEEVSPQDLETKDWLLTNIKTVEYDSPAIRLGHLVLAGWSSQDLVYQGDNFQMAEIDDKQLDGDSLLPIVIGLASLFLPGGWLLRIGRAVVVMAATAAFTKKK